MQRYLIAFLAVMLGVQCSAPQNKTDARPQAQASVRAGLQTTISRTALSADTLRAGGKVMLRLAPSHPAGLAIIDPGGAYYYIQNAGETQLMEPAAYTSLKELSISADIEGLYYDDGKPVTRPVFTKPGKYTLYLADDLETEPENTNAESLNLWFLGGAK